MTTPDIKELITSQEAAELLGIKKTTLEGMRSRGRGPVYYKIGNDVKYLEKDVLVWRKKNREPVRIDPEADNG